MKYALSLILTLALGAVGPLQAQPAESCCANLHKQSDSGIAYASGGIGEEERQALNSRAANYNLKLLFADKKSGEFLSDIRVSIKGTKGTDVLDAVADGPWFFASLPPGSYRVTAASGEQRQTRPIAVRKGKQSRLSFYF